MIRLKTSEEIERIRQSCRLLVETYEAIIPLAQPGVTTAELDKAAYDYIVKRGGKPAFLNYHGYPATLCTSVHETLIHGIPSKRKLKPGDILSLDLGIDLGGYFSDAALTLPIGTITPEARRLLAVTRQALYDGIEQAKAGNRIRDISRAVFNRANSNGYGVVREYCGHGVGFAVHEDPQIPNYVGGGPNTRIKPGMVLAIEPMINMGEDEIVLRDDNWTVETEDGSLSAHFEHTVAVFEDHTEILTRMDSGIL